MPKQTKNALMPAELANALLGTEAGDYSRRMSYARPGLYTTRLSPDEEIAFRQWVVKNRVPFDPDNQRSDYDMRGFWKGLMTGDPNARTGMNQNDQQLHYTDYWKTPFHKSFSGESRYAQPGAGPKWNERDQLVMPDGTVLYDERADVARMQAARLMRGGRR